MNDSGNDSDLGFAEDPDMVMSNLIQTIYRPVLFLFGGVGNIVSILVLAQTKNRKTSIGVLLICVSLADTFILTFSVLKTWIATMVDVDVRSSSNTMCKVDIFLTYLSVQASPWILVIVTIERTYCVLYPFKVKAVFTRANVLISVAIVMVCLSCLNLHLLFAFHLETVEYSPTEQCIVRIENEYFVFDVWPWIDFCFAFFVPFCVLFVGNTIIVVKLRSSKHFREGSINESFHTRKQNSCRSSSHIMVEMASINTLTSGSCPGTPKQNNNNDEIANYNNDDSTNNEENNLHSLPRRKSSATSSYVQVTIALNTVFIVLVLPSVIFGIGQPFWYPPEVMSDQKYAELTLIATVVYMLMYTNNAVNFIFYVLLGSKFRNDLMRLCRCYRTSASSSTTQASSFRNLSTLRSKSSRPDSRSSQMSDNAYPVSVI